MIGKGGLGLVGKSARRKQVKPKLGALPGVPSKPGAPWKITAAAMKGVPPKWTYTINVGGLKTEEVLEDDDDWELVEVSINPVEKAVGEFLGPKIEKLAPTGEMVNWIKHAETIETHISACILMDAEKFSSNEVPYLWSGGAADCVIVAAFSQVNAKAYLTHATRVSSGSVADTVEGMGIDVKVWLSSQYFGLGADTAAQAGTVQDIVSALMKKKLDVVACYGTGKLAINGWSGEVLASFPNPKPTK